MVFFYPKFLCIATPGICNGLPAWEVVILIASILSQAGKENLSAQKTVLLCGAGVCCSIATAAGGKLVCSPVGEGAGFWLEGILELEFYCTCRVARDFFFENGQHFLMLLFCDGS